MKIRFGLPLPGPFYLSSGGGGRRKGGCLPVLGIALVIGFAMEYPWLWAVAGGFAVLLIAAAVTGRNRNRF